MISVFRGENNFFLQTRSVLLPSKHVTKFAHSFSQMFHKLSHLWFYYDMFKSNWNSCKGLCTLCILFIMKFFSELQKNVFLIDRWLIKSPPRTSIEALNGDINKLDGQIRKISSQMKSSNTEPDVASQMGEFLPVSHPTSCTTTTTTTIANTRPLAPPQYHEQQNWIFTQWLFLFIEACAIFLHFFSSVC